MTSGKRSRERRRRAQAERAKPSVHASTPAEKLAMAEEMMSASPLMPCRLTYLDDPVITGGGSAKVITDVVDGELILEDRGTEDPVPVVLFELPKMLMAVDTRTGAGHEMRVDYLLSLGFRRIEELWFALEEAPGFDLYRTDKGVVLCNPEGAPWAEGHVELDPKWVSTATSLGGVAVFYGPRLGIRTPEEFVEPGYTLQDRIGDFRATRRMGLCAGALVPWHATSTHDARHWFLFPPRGLLGLLPWPTAYVPRREFEPDGGPEAFGFRPLKDAFVTRTYEPATATGLVANVSATDVDLVRPGLDPELAPVAGYRAPHDDGSVPYFQHAARQAGGIMVIVGVKQLPLFPDGHLTPDQQRAVLKVLDEAHAALVPLADQP